MKQPDMDITQGNESSVSELQNALRRLALADSRLPLIAVDGIFGPETTEAVTAFQRRQGLPANGRVDLTTWETIRQELQRIQAAQSAAVPLTVFKQNMGPVLLRSGDTGLPVYALQLLLACAAEEFDNLPAVEVNGAFDDQTEAAIKAFQPLCGLEATGVADRASWNQLSGLFNRRAAFPHR